MNWPCTDYFLKFSKIDAEHFDRVRALSPHHAALRDHIAGNKNGSRTRNDIVLSSAKMAETAGGPGVNLLTPRSERVLHHPVVGVNVCGGDTRPVSCS